jgi:integrase/recombinase XerD
MTSSSEATFKRNYQTHLQHLKLKGLQPKTIEAYARAIRRIGAYFDHQINDLSEQQLTDYFTDLLESHSWSAVKLDLYGLKFYYAHVLHKPWENIGLIKPPKTQRLPDIVTIEEAKRLFAATLILSYRIFYFTIYSLGLRLGEGLRLQVGDIDANRRRVHIRDAKGNKDRLVPLPDATLDLLRRFWQVHRNPVLLFPNRHGGLKAAHRATTPLERGGVQTTLCKVVAECGIKKRSPRTAFVTVMPPMAHGALRDPLIFFFDRDIRRIDRQPIEFSDHRDHAVPAIEYLINRLQRGSRHGEAQDSQTVPWQDNKAVLSQDGRTVTFSVQGCS